MTIGLLQQPTNDLLIEQAKAENDQRQAFTKAHIHQRRSFRSEPHRRARKRLETHELGEGYDELPTQEGWLSTEQGFVWASVDYSKLAQIAKRYATKAKLQDQPDLLHDIIIGLADVVKARIAKGNPLSEIALYRIAEHIKDYYWYRRYAYYYGLDCKHCSKEQRAKCSYNWQFADYAYTDCHRAIELESLNELVSDSDGFLTEMGNLIADDKAIDLEAWTEKQLWLISAPIRLKAIASKLSKGKALSVAERKYLCKLRKREQRKLL